MSYFGERLKRHLETRGVTPHKAALTSGVLAPDLYNAMAGRRHPSEAMLEKLASVSDLGLDIEAIRAWAAVDKIGADNFKAIRKHCPELCDLERVG